MLRFWPLPLALILAAGPALAQRTPVYQDGTASAGHVAKYATQGRVTDAGGLSGDALGKGVSPFAVTDSLGLGQCLNSAATGGQYNAFCLGHDAYGNAQLTVDSYGGYAAKGLNVVLNGTSYPMVGLTGGNAVAPTSPSPTAGNLAIWNGGVALRDASGTSAAAITTAGAAAAVQANGSKTASDISLYAGGAANDYSAMRSVLTVTNGSTIGQNNGYASYIYNDTTSDGFHGNAINYYSICGVAKPAGYCWGLNPVLTDDAVGASGTGGSRVLNNELDFNIRHTDTIASGLMLTGASTATSPNTFALNVTATDAAAGTTNHPWAIGANFATGATTTAIAINPTAPGNSVGTPPIVWNFNNSSGVLKNYAMAATEVSFNFTSLLASPVWNFSGSVHADSVVVGAGSLTSVNGIFQSAIGVGTVTLEGTGTINAVTYYANNTVGVTCSGAPTSSFASVGGIVTHC